MRNLKNITNSKNATYTFSFKAPKARKLTYLKVVAPSLMQAFKQVPKAFNGKVIYGVH
jgi:hypothetical protein